MMRSIPVVDFSDYTSGEPKRQEKFIQSVGDSLKDIGFFALENHGIPLESIDRAYEQGDVFFSLEEPLKNHTYNHTSHTSVATLHLELNMPKTTLLLI